MPYLNLSKITLPENDTDYNIWADYVELICLLEEDRILSVETFKDRLINECDEDTDKALKKISGVNKPLNLTPEIDKIADDQNDSDIIDLENEQKIKTEIIKVVSYLKQRQAAISNFYPFTVDSHFCIKVNSDINNHRKLYVILLLSSLIRIIQERGGFAYKITHNFEKLCMYPFKMLIPSLSIVEFFGAGGYINKERITSGSFYEKVVELAGKLSVPPHPSFTRQEAGNYNNGDGGLDWVGYMPFKDKLNSVPTFFAQCACGNDWEDKQFDAHKDKWRNFISFKNDPIIYHFIPKSFRNPNNDWQKESNIYNVVLIDRFRLLELIDKSGHIGEIIEWYTDVLSEIESIANDFN